METARFRALSSFVSSHLASFPFPFAPPPHPPLSVSKQNLNVFFEMGKEDCALVEALDEGKRMGWGGPLLPEGAADAKPRDIAHRDYPFVFPHDPEKF